MPDELKLTDDERKLIESRRAFLRREALGATLCSGDGSTVKQLTSVNPDPQVFFRSPIS